MHVLIKGENTQPQPETLQQKMGRHRLKVSLEELYSGNARETRGRLLTKARSAQQMTVRKQMIA